VVGGLYRYVRKPDVPGGGGGRSWGRRWRSADSACSGMPPPVFVAVAVFVHGYEEPTLSRQFGDEYAAVSRRASGDGFRPGSRGADHRGGTVGHTGTVRAGSGRGGCLRLPGWSVTDVMCHVTAEPTRITGDLALGRGECLPRSWTCPRSTAEQIRARGPPGTSRTGHHAARTELRLCSPPSPSSATTRR